MRAPRLRLTPAILRGNGLPSWGHTEVPRVGSHSQPSECCPERQAPPQSGTLWPTGGGRSAVPCRPDTCPPHPRHLHQ